MNPDEHLLPCVDLPCALSHRQTTISVWGGFLSSCLRVTAGHSSPSGVATCSSVPSSDVSTVVASCSSSGLHSAGFCSSPVILTTPCLAIAAVLHVAEFSRLITAAF
ncbi:hypothetical protein NL108_003021 [Boleophthalmus pectinirostris]|nr:hypothetical protein NL108_003021 [Boleophthalmus pectinirostris]